MSAAVPIYEHWSCLHCGAEGEIRVTSEQTCDQTYSQAQDAHEDASPKCPYRPYIERRR